MQITAVGSSNVRQHLHFAVCAALALGTCGCRSLGGKHWWHSTQASRQLAVKGAAELEQGRYTAAEDVLRKAVNACPEDPDAHGYLAQALWRKGVRTEALSHQEEACRLAPRNPAHLREASKMFLEQGDLASAIERSNLAIDAAPDDPQNYLIRAQVLRLQGEREKALADVHRALAISPHDPELMWIAVEVYRELSRPHMAYAMLSEIAQSYPRDGLPIRYWKERGLALAALRRGEEAAESFRMATRTGGTDPEVLSELAKVELALGRRAQAESAVQQALTAKPDHAASLALQAKMQGSVRTASLPTTTGGLIHEAANQPGSDRPQ